MEKQIFLQDSPSLLDLCTLHQHAMRYYRLWIYACNTVLALATLVFTVFAVSVLVDPRITLLSGVELYQPTFLYAYVALLLQCGVLQTIGCLGALRLNQKLLNTYWTLLLVLMIGDIIVGLVWAFRLDRIKSTLKPNLKNRLSTHYGTDPDFTQVWDWLQSHEMCCGVETPYDFLRENESLGIDNYDEVNGLPYENSLPLILPKMPSSCCTFSIRNTASTPSPEQHNAKGSGNGRRHSHPNDISSLSSNPQNNLNSNYSSILCTRSTVASKNIEHLNGIVDTNRVMLNLVQEQGSSSGSGSSSGTKTQGSVFHHRRVNKSKHNQPYTTTASSSSNPQNTNRVMMNLVQEQGLGSGSGSSSGTKTQGSALHHRRQNKSKNNQPYKTTSAPQPVTTEPPIPPFTCAIPKHIPTNSVLIPTPPSLHSSNLAGSGSGSSGSEESQSSLVTNSYEITTTPSVHLIASSSLSSSQRPPLSSTTPSPKFVPKPHLVGCAIKVLEWLDHVTDVLFVIGFCIIVFLKGCFIAILRYEIKEMIQKIRMMNGEDPVHTAAMNELIGLTSLYENGDGGEGEELMAPGATGDNTSNTNLDEMESDKFLRKSDGKRGSSGSGGILGLVRDTDDLMGNNVNAAVKRSYYGNHIGTNANNTSAPAAISTKHEIEDDFDSSSALLGRYDSAGRKYRDQNGGRALPRNGNNNSAITLPSSTSAPNPIETVASVNSSAC